MSVREPGSIEGAEQPLAPPAPASIHHPVPTNPDVGSPYGMRVHPILGYQRPHRGADIGCQAGEPIVAAADGRQPAAQSLTLSQRIVATLGGSAHAEPRGPGDS